jgi:hypothetical protein
MEAWTDFGQRVDLTARIREILINYPEGTSILKELVQVGRVEPFTRGRVRERGMFMHDKRHRCLAHRQPASAMRWWPDA